MSTIILPPSPPPSRSSSQTSVSRKPTTYNPNTRTITPSPTPPRRQKPTLTLDPSVATGTFLASATPTSSTLRSFFSPCTDSEDSDSGSDSDDCDCDSPIKPLRPRGHFQRLWASRPSMPPSTPPPAPFSPAHIPPAPSAPHTGVFPPPSPWETTSMLPADPLLRHLHALLAPLLDAVSVPCEELRAARAARERAMVGVQKAHFRRAPVDAARRELADAEARERSVERGVVAAFLRRVEGVQSVCEGFVNPEKEEEEVGEEAETGEEEEEEVWTCAREWPEQEQEHEQEEEEEELRSAWDEWNDERRFTWVPSHLASESDSEDDDEEEEEYHADPTRDPSFPLPPLSPDASVLSASPALSYPGSPNRECEWGAFLPPSPALEGQEDEGSRRGGTWKEEKGLGVDWGVVVVVEGVQMNMI